MPPKKKPDKTPTRDDSDDDSDEAMHDDDFFDSATDVFQTGSANEDDEEELDEEFDEELDDELDEDEDVYDEVDGAYESDGEAGSDDEESVAVVTKTRCMYNKVENQSDDDELEDYVFDDDDADDADDESSRRIPDNERVAKPILTKYERIRVLGERAHQIALGAKVMVTNVEGLSSSEIAELEIANNLIPITIHKPMPNNRYEVWQLHELTYL